MFSSIPTDENHCWSKNIKKTLIYQIQILIFDIEFTKVLDS